MNKLNLSTQPFYNERALDLVFKISTTLLLLFFMRGLFHIGVLLERQEVSEIQISEEHALNELLARDIARLHRESASMAFARMANDLEEARDLVERRVFSWSSFLSDLESGIPSSVMLTAITPQIDNNVISFSLGIRGQSSGDLSLFVERLERSAVFSELLIKEETLSQDGNYLGTLEGLYRESDYNSER